MVVIVLFFLYKLFATKIPRPSSSEGAKLLDKMLKFVFVLALMALVLGGAGYLYAVSHGTTKTEKVEVSGTLTDARGPAAGVTVIAAGSPLSTMTNEAGYFRIVVDRSALSHDSVRLILQVDHQGTVLLKAAADTPFAIALPQLLSESPTDHGAYDATVAAATGSLLAAQELIRSGRFAEVRDLADGILSRWQSLRTTLPNSRTPEDSAFARLRSMTAIARDSLRWLESVADSLQMVAQTVLPRAKGELFHRLFCEVVASTETIVQKQVRFQNHYVDYPPSPPALQQLRDALNTAHDSLRVLRLRGQASNCE